MFLLPSLLLGLIFAVLLGGRPSRMLEVPLRVQWTVLAALGLQVVIFSRLGEGLAEPLREALHLASYVLLLVFATANARIRALVLVLLGLFLNAVAIAANGGRMPVSSSAADAVGLAPGSDSNVSETADRLRFLGDVFALPAQLPLANVFSVGDLLIGCGMIAFVVVVSIGDGREPALSLSRIVAPLRLGTYRRLVAGRLVSQVGDWLTLAALVGWIYQASGSTQHVAVLLLLRLAPPVLGGGLAAFIVDRLPKQPLLVWIEVARGAAVAGALGGVLTSDRTIVFVAFAVSGALAAMSSAAVPALLPSVLPDGQLPSANAGLGIAKDAAMALGAGTAGLALSAVGAAAALAVDLVTFAAAAALYATLRISGATLSAGARRGGPSGFRYLLGRRRLLLLVVSFATATVATGLTNATLPRFLDDSIGLGPGGYGFGIAALATGLALGEALVGFARVGPSAGRWIGAGLLLMAGLLALLALEEHAPTALLLLAVIGFVDGTTDVLYQTVVQREADPRYYGSVFGFSSAFMTSTMMGAVAAAPLANSLLGAPEALLLAAVPLVWAGAIALVGMRQPGAASSLPAPAGAKT